MATLNSTLYAAQTQTGEGKAPIPSGPLCAGALVAQRCVIAVPATGNGTALNDTLGLFVVPKGAIIHSFDLMADQLDSGGSPLLTLDAGWTGAAQALIAAWAGASGATSAAVSPNAIKLPLSATDTIGYQFLADTPIFVTVHAAAATKKAGNLAATIVYEMGGLTP